MSKFQNAFLKKKFITPARLVHLNFFSKNIDFSLSSLYLPKNYTFSMYFSSLFIIMESLVVAVIKTININIKSRKPYINTINLIFSLMLLEPI